MRLGPLLAIIVLMVLVISTMSSFLLWAIAGVSLAALGALIFFSAKADRFVGPRVLLDDARESFERFGREEKEEEVIVEVKPKDSPDDHR